MIEYEYLCEAITAWKEGRRPQPLAPTGQWAGRVESLDSDVDVDVYGDDSADADAYGDDSEYGGAPIAVAATGTEPITADAIDQGDVQAPPYNPYAEAPYSAGEPTTGQFSQDDLQAAAAASGYDDDVGEVEEVDLDVDADDDDGDDGDDDFERDYDLEEIDDAAGFDFANDLAGYFRGEMLIEMAWDDRAGRIAALNQYGIRDEPHYYQVKATLERFVMSEEAEARYGGLDAIMQIQANARMDHSMGAMQARAQGELAGELAPVEGISLQQWAHAQAGLASGGDADTIIAGLGIDRAHWDRVSAEWNARMSRDTTATIATEYGKAFSTSGQGQYAGAAAETAGALSVGGDVGDTPPMPLDRYVEIMVAQSAAADQGRDPSELLAQFGLTPMEWGQVGGWWGSRIARHGMENGQALLHEFNAAQAKYEAQYAIPDADDDVDY